MHRAVIGLVRQASRQALEVSQVVFVAAPVRRCIARSVKPLRRSVAVWLNGPARV